MKRYIYTSIYILILISFTSCRSTSKPCGLADNFVKYSKNFQTNQTQQFMKS